MIITVPNNPNRYCFRTHAMLLIKKYISWRTLEPLNWYCLVMPFLLSLKRFNGAFPLPNSLPVQKSVAILPCNWELTSPFPISKIRWSSFSLLGPSNYHAILNLLLYQFLLVLLKYVSKQYFMFNLFSVLEFHWKWFPSRLLQ